MQWQLDDTNSKRRFFVWKSILYAGLNCFYPGYGGPKKKIGLLGKKKLKLKFVLKKINKCRKLVLDTGLKKKLDFNLVN